MQSLSAVVPAKVGTCRAAIEFGDTAALMPAPSQLRGSPSPVSMGEGPRHRLWEALLTVLYLADPWVPAFAGTTLEKFEEN